MGEDKIPILEAALSLEAIPQDAGKLLREIDFAIRWLIVDEMAHKAPDQRVGTGTSMAFGADVAAVARVLPERQAWVFSTSFQQKVGMDGIDGFFDDRWNEAAGVARAARDLGLMPVADALESMIKELSATSAERASWKDHIARVRRARDAAPRDGVRLAETADWTRIRLEYALRNRGAFFAQASAT